jgi:hypothetical protein
MKRTWNEKLKANNGLPKVGRIPASMQSRWGKGTMVIPSPLEVDGIMKAIAKGKLITIADIRARLALKHRTKIACSLTTGIFAWIAAHAAEESAAAGRKRITPYWRTLKSGGEINTKFPHGIRRQIRRLEAEGHRIVQRGKRYFVADFEKSLAFSGSRAS